MAAPTFHYRWQWTLRSEAERLWPYLSDTQRFNAAAGVPPLSYTETAQPDGSVRRVATTWLYGVRIAWEELPFQWVLNREVVETRRFLSGPIKDFKVRMQLEPKNGKTLLTYEVWATPSNALGYPGIPVQIGVYYRLRFGRVIKQVDDFIQANAPEPFQSQHTPVSAAGRARLRELSAQLVGANHDEVLVQRLIEFIQSAPDDQLTRIRAYSLADAWGADRYQVLELFLRATRSGLLDLSWDMICPECRGAKHRSHSLHDVSHAAHCPSCNIDYEVDFAQSVEATFQVNPAIRRVMAAEYCKGSPQNTPHLIVQQALAPGETRTIHVSLKPGRYRWAAPHIGAAHDDGQPHTVKNLESALAGQALIKVRSRADITSCTVTLADDLHVQPADILAGDVTVTLVNQTNEEQHVSLGEVEWSAQASTAAEVTSLQTFRDLFSSEALRPGESIGVENLTILFTDLKGSTVLYRTFGDAPVFRRVMDHFTILREGVARHHGGLVKTIGDAIMAVFPDPTDGVAAALDILDEIKAFNVDTLAVPIVLKMGIHQGACIAVTLNDRLDYFGSVVNLAARLEGQSRGDDVVLSEAVASDPGVAELLQERGATIETFTTTVKGFQEAVSLRRVSLGQNQPMLT